MPCITKCRCNARCYFDLLAIASRPAEAVERIQRVKNTVQRLKVSLANTMMAIMPVAVPSFGFFFLQMGSVH